MNDILSVLKKHGITLLPVWNSGFQRDGSQWLKAIQIESNGHKISRVYFGDYARSLSETWQSQGDASIPPEAMAELQKQIEEYEREQNALRLKEQATLSERYSAEFENLPNATADHPYLKRKDVGAYGLKILTNTNALVIPMRDTEGKLWNFQRILSQKILLERTGEMADKFFTPGCRIDGTFHTLPATGTMAPQDELRGGLELPAGVGSNEEVSTGNAVEQTEAGGRSHDRCPKVLYVCEGYATGASVYEALQKAETVVVAFNSQNLPKTASVLREKYPDCRLIFIADNDQWKPEKGNAGVKKATEAAQIAAPNSEIIVPFFPKELHDKKPTDMNDMHMLMGLKVVEAQVRGTYNSDALKPLIPEGKSKKVSELAIVTTLLNHYSGRLLCQGRDFFMYADGHWQHLGEQGEVLMKRMIAEILGGAQASKDINSAYALLLIKCPQPPKNVDLFSPEFYRVNFENGTLHAIVSPGKKVELKFRDHDPSDYITNKVPFAYNPESSITNSMWLEYLDKVFAQDADKHDKIRVLAQLFGAALLPCYSRIFLLIGKPGSGKSTIMKVLARLVGERNISRVQPSDFEGFNLVTMVGKTVNMDTDINTKKPIADDIVKKIIDRAPFHVRRKFQADLYAPLPPIHVFGGNGLPKSSDGETAAYGRRVVILRTGSLRVSQNNYDHDYAEQLWDAGPEGILNFAMSGLKDLLELRGHFTIPDSSSLEVEKWNMESDVIGQFLADLAHGAVSDTQNTFGLKEMSEHGRIERKNFYELFKEWFKTAHPHGRAPGRNSFFTVVEGKGFATVTVQGTRFFSQANINASPDSLI